MSTRHLPTTERLNELFQLDAENGLLIRKKSTRKVGTNLGQYQRVTVDNTKFLLHRLIYKMAFGVDPGEYEVDHINRDPSDNRPQNLRLCTHKQNTANRSGCGVRKHGAGYQTRCHGAVIGQYKTFDQARSAYINAKNELHGTFSPYSN